MKNFGASGGGYEHQVSEQLLQLVSFRLAGEEFCLEILRMREIIRARELTRVPNSPPYVEGVLNLRGRIIPVVNLRLRVGLRREEVSAATRIIVVEVNNNLLGFVVDSVSEVLRIPASKVEPPPRITKVEREYIAGVAQLEDRLLLLLDLDYLLSQQEEREVEELRATEQQSAESASA